jgi:hypothetical protein
MLAYNKKNLIMKTWDELVNDHTVSPNDIADKFQKNFVCDILLKYSLFLN